MGQELNCKARLPNRHRMAGKAQLETDYLLFRGPERIKISFGQLTGVMAEKGVLILEFPDGPAEFELGPAAEKWAHKILNPPSLMDKIGVRKGLTVRLIGQFERDFQKQIADREALIVSKGKCDLLFLAADKSAALDRISKLKADLKTPGALWVLYPKAVSDIKGVQVIQAGRAAGMKDIKVARFSATHTALKFV